MDIIRSSGRIQFATVRAPSGIKCDGCRFCKKPLKTPRWAVAMSGPHGGDEREITVVYGVICRNCRRRGRHGDPEILDRRGEVHLALLVESGLVRARRRRAPR